MLCDRVAVRPIFSFLMIPPPPRSTLFPYTTLFRSADVRAWAHALGDPALVRVLETKARSEEHTSELQSQFHLVCRLLLEKKTSEPSTCRTSAAPLDRVVLLKRSSTPTAATSPCACA